MLADGTNLFYLESDIDTLFTTVNSELQKECVISKKLSLKVKKTVVSFFHKASKKDKILLVSLKLFIINYQITRVESIKFFRDDNLT